MESNISKNNELIKLYEEPLDNILGPVAFMYMTGDPGDGITRKILMLADIHKRDTGCGKYASMSSAEFIRYLASKCPKIIDVFIESNFASENNPPLPNAKLIISKNYLMDMLFDFRNCLTREKKYCNEPMRVHYADTRHIFNNVEISPGSYLNYLSYLTIGIQTEAGKILQWPNSPKEIQDIVDASIIHSRLTNKRLNILHPNILFKFQEMILNPVLQKYRDFFENNNNKIMFEHINFQILQGNDINTLHNEINILHFNLMVIGAELSDAYAIYRMLKRTSNKEGERPKLSNKNGYTTHIVTYMGSAHVFNIYNNLLKLGMMLKGYDDKDNNFMAACDENRSDERDDYKVNQCLKYKDIQNSVEDFCELNQNILPTLEFKYNSQEIISEPLEKDIDGLIYFGSSFNEYRRIIFCSMADEDIKCSHDVITLSQFINFIKQEEKSNILKLHLHEFLTNNYLLQIKSQYKTYITCSQKILRSSNKFWINHLSHFLSPLIIFLEQILNNEIIDYKLQSLFVPLSSVSNKVNF